MDNEQRNEAVDERGTTQESGRAMLAKLRDQGFNSHDDELAVALGRPVEEVRALLSGAAVVDDDLIMKARGIAKERKLNIE